MGIYVYKNIRNFPENSSKKLTIFLQFTIITLAIFYLLAINRVLRTPIKEVNRKTV